MTQQSSLFAFLPWLELREDLATGPFQLQTILKASLPNPSWTERVNRHVMQLIGQHRSIKGEPRESITLICRDGQPLFEGAAVSPETKQQILRSCQLAAVAAIAENSLRGTGFGYANYSIFRPIFHEGSDLGGPWLSFTFRRKHFTLTDMGYKANEVQFSCPAWAHGIHGVRVDQKLLAGLQRFLSPDIDKNEAAILKAISCFLQTYTDEEWTVDDEEAADTLKAIEVLLKAATKENPLHRCTNTKLSNGFSNKEILADRLESLLGLVRGRNTLSKSSKRPIPSHLKHLDESVLWNWFVDLYYLRSGVFHEGAANPGMWTSREHSIIGAQVFLVALKHALIRRKLLDIPDDLARPILVAEKVLCEREWWKSDDNEKGDAWARAEREVLHDALKEIFRKEYEQNRENP